MSTLNPNGNAVSNSPIGWSRLHAKGRLWHDPLRALEASSARETYIAELFHTRRSSFSFGGGLLTRPGQEVTQIEDEPWEVRLKESGKGEFKFRMGTENLSVALDENGWWKWSPNDGWAHCGQSRQYEGPGRLLFAPDELINSLMISSIQIGNRIGRTTRELVAAPTPITSPLSDIRLHGVGLGADEYCLSYDDERGILLRTEARWDGIPFRIIEVLDIQFDGEIEDVVPALRVLAKATATATGSSSSLNDIGIYLPRRLVDDPHDLNGFIRRIDREDRIIFCFRRRRRSGPDYEIISIVLSNSSANESNNHGRWFRFRDMLLWTDRRDRRGRRCKLRMEIGQTKIVIESSDSNLRELVTIARSMEPADSNWGSS